MSHRAGIDPGLKGGIAIANSAGVIVHVCDIPIIQHTKAQKLVNANAVGELLFDTYDVTHVIIENVATRPGQGIASSGNFMKAVGTLYGVAAGCGAVVFWVAPQVWKKHYGLVGPNKEASRAKAIELFPNIASALKFKKDADKAEAALMVNYGRLKKFPSVTGKIPQAAC